MGGAGRLPAHLLFSDRDFNENDYEALLALDDGIENRKGASALPCSGPDTDAVYRSGTASVRLPRWRVAQQ